MAAGQTRQDTEKRRDRKESDTRERKATQRRIQTMNATSDLEPRVGV